MKFAKTLSGIFVFIIVFGCIVGSGCLDIIPKPTDKESPEAVKDIDPENAPFEVYLVKESDPDGTYTIVQNRDLYLSDESNSGETINIVLDSLIIIKLEDNPTTGYQWEYSLTDRLSMLGETYDPSDTSGDVVGAGGTHIWILYAFDTGTYTFSAVYKRPFEELTGDEKTVTFTFIVE